jgi:hypothetical protein
MSVMSYDYEQTANANVEFKAQNVPPERSGTEGRCFGYRREFVTSALATSHKNAKQLPENQGVTKSVL